MVAPTQHLDVGLHFGVPASRYHADDLCAQPSLSSGVLRTILNKSIEHGALEHARIGGQKRDRTPSMNLGSITHSLLAGENTDLVEGDFDSFHSKASQKWRAKVEAEGKTPVLERDLVDARPIVKAVREKAALGITNDPFAAHGVSEVTAIWKEGDAYCRARYDRLVVGEDYADIWDWKSADDISERAIVKSIVSLQYHVQAAFYLRGLNAVLPRYIGRTSFIFVFVETSAPYHVRRVVLSPSFQAIGRKKVSEGIAIWQQAIATNRFTVGAMETLEVEAPAYLDEDDEISVS